MTGRGGKRTRGVGGIVTQTPLTCTAHTGSSPRRSMHRRPPARNERATLQHAADMRKRSRIARERGEHRVDTVGNDTPQCVAANFTSPGNGASEAARRQAPGVRTARTFSQRSIGASTAVQVRKGVQLRRQRTGHASGTRHARRAATAAAAAAVEPRERPQEEVLATAARLVAADARQAGRRARRPRTRRHRRAPKARLAPIRERAADATTPRRVPLSCTSRWHCAG
jgi:hypothetical protein